MPYRLLFPAIMVFSAIGIYSVNNSAFELYLTALFGVVGFIWMKLGSAWRRCCWDSCWGR